jgi:cytochrome c oxidase assembly factor CtaG
MDEIEKLLPPLFYMIGSFHMLGDLSLTWPWNPEALAFLLILSLLYLLGVRKPGLRDAPRIVAFFFAIIISALVLLTPIDSIARTQLFSVHMAQAVILTTLCVPLILFGCPASLLQPLLKLPVVRNIVRVLTRPLVASILFNLTFLLWHAPKFYSAAQADEALYHLMMLSIFFTALLNWWPLIGSVHELCRISYPLQMLYAFLDGQPVDIFAFVLVFTGVPIYTSYAVSLQVGVPAYADQAVAGAILLIPGIIDLVVMTPLFFRWLGQIEQRTKLADQQRQEEEEEVLDDEVPETSEA